MSPWTRLAAFVERLPKVMVLVVCGLLLAGVGAVDLLSGGEIVFSVFYAVPITIVAWVFGRGAGFFTALLATLMWTLNDLHSLDQSLTTGVPWWNAGVRLAFFALIVFILTALKKALAEEQRLARVDALTQAPNARWFRERVDFELRRSARSGTPLTVVMLDVDDLKRVNDEQGHAAGDELLSAVAAAWRAALRGTDLFARMGGDEFAAALPDTDVDAAVVALYKGRHAAMAAIERGAWPASLSIGAVTVRSGGATLDELLRRADALMYRVKGDGKNDVRVEEYRAPAAGETDGSRSVPGDG